MFRIWKKILRIIAIILPCFLTIFVSQNSYAVSDHTFTYDSSNSSTSPYICGNNSGVDCSDYSYIILESEDNGIYSIGTHAIAFYMTLNITNGATAQQYNMNYEMSPRIVLTIPVNGISDFQVWTIGSLTRTVTITLTNTACPACEECQPIPENPYHDDLTSIRNVIIVSASVVLVLYFFYCIYGMIIPTTGVKK